MAAGLDSDVTGAGGRSRTARPVAAAVRRADRDSVLAILRASPGWRLPPRDEARALRERVRWFVSRA